MTPWGDAFLTDLHREHLEEISFLHEHRARALAGDTGVDLGRVAELEARMEAHLDALALGGPLASACCERRAVAGDFGELHGALRIFCRAQSWAHASRAILAADLDAPPVARAVIEALGHEAPRAWAAALGSWLAGDDPRLRSLAAPVVGMRRLGACAGAVIDAAHRTESPRPLLWAAGRLADLRAAGVLERSLHDSDPATSTDAALAMLRLRLPDAPRRIAERLRAAPWLSPALALAGGRDVLRVLREAAGRSEPSTMLALGLLGDSAAIDALLSGVAHETTAESAAVALFLITGAPLLDPADPRRLSIDASAWRAWWDAQRSAFAPGLRYRLGQPASARAHAQTLTSSFVPMPVRRLVVDELVIRHGFPAMLEHDSFVRHQIAALRGLESHMHASGAVGDGRWYYAGRLV